jgi:hypothetical protein
VGARYEYSNAGYTLLAVVIEEVTGRRYEEYLRDTFYRPHGLTHTGLTAIAIDDSLVARSHNARREYRSPADRPGDAWNLYGNGGQLSTTGDMYRWVRALRDGRLVPPEYRDRMFARYAAEGPEERCHYGYGWSICDTRRGGDVIWHNGGSMGLWSCAVYQYVDDDAVFIVFTNSTIDGRSPVDHICVNLSRILFGEPVDLPPAVYAATEVDAAPFAGTWGFGTEVAIVVTPGDAAVEVMPVGQSAMAAVFPSSMSDMLPKYNGKTRALVEALRAGEFDRAGRDVEMEPGSPRTGAEWLRGWWESIDGIDRLEEVEVLGTKFVGAAKTYTRLHLPQGTRDYCFHWMMGRCVGIAPAEPPKRIFQAVAPDRFVAFGMEDSVELEFSSNGTARLTSGERTLEGRRSP